MKISRQVGTVSEILNVFINDATVSTGAGLANIVASTISFSWFRSDMAAVSTGTATTGTMGTYTVSTFVQCSSTGALGWYQFMPPNGMFLSGRSAALHIYGAPNMAPLPIEVELTKTDNQTYMSSQTLSTNALVNVNLVLGSTPVTSAAGIFSVNVTTILGSVAVTNAAGILEANMKSVYGSAPVTTAAGVLATTWDLSRTANLTSTIALTGTSISTNQLVNMNQILGSAPVTTAAGVQAVAWDLGRTANLTSTIALTGTTISTNQLVNVNQVLGSTPVTSAAGVFKAEIATIYGTPPVTTAAGIFATVFDLGRTANATSTVALTGTTISGSQNVSTLADKTGFALTAAYDAAKTAAQAGDAMALTAAYNAAKTAAQAGDAMALTSGERNSVADAFLGRNVSGGSSSGRLVKESFYVLRNKVDASAGIVYQTDDTTSSWAFSVSTAAGNPIQVITPI